MRRRLEKGAEIIISSSANPRIKQIRSLRQRSEREQTGLFFIEGIRIVAEALQLQAEVTTLISAPELLKSDFAHALLREQQEKGLPCLEVTAEIFKGLSVKEGPQGLGALVRQRWEPLEQVQLAPADCWVALDAAQDPGNIGTIMRTADAVGGAGLLLLGNCADPYDPAALRASMGAIFAQRLVKASFSAFAHWKQSHGYQVVGTSGAALHDYREIAYPRPAILLMGSERQGLTPDMQALCDLMVKIPMVGRSDSLNLAVATGITLYEIFYQSRQSASR